MAKDLAGKTALITGASSGIGTSMARQLAERGAHVVLVARRKDRLDALKSEIESAYGVKATVLPMDLGVAGSGTALFDQTEGAGIRIDYLINNAGFGTKQTFVDIPWERTAEMIQLNMTTLTEATLRFASKMKERGSGKILNVSSIGAFQPTPQYAAYGASKAYVRNFSIALGNELSGTGVTVTCLCPGATTTEFAEVAGQPVSKVQALAFMSADRCARIGLAAMLSGRRLIVSGFMNACAMWFIRFMPYRLSAWFAGKALELQFVRDNLPRRGEIRPIVCRWQRASPDDSPTQCRVDENEANSRANRRSARTSLTGLG
jgi:hypothetical protein